MREKIIRRERIDVFLFATVAVLVIWQLFIPPVLSVANDHDFEKIVGHRCLGPVDTGGPLFFDYTVLRFHYDPDACIDWPMRTANELTFHAARILNNFVLDSAVFDLRAMGVILSLIFLAGFRSLQRTLREVPATASFTVQLAWIAVACNAVYVPYLNTLYYDGLAIAVLTGALASVSMAALSREPKVEHIVAASLWLALLAGSKSQHALTALIFLPALWLRRPGLTGIRTAGTLLVAGAAAVTLGTTPRFYQGEATFTALFYRILPTVPAPEAYLAETKIPVSWAQFTGETAYSEIVPLRDYKYEQAFGEWFGPLDLGMLYLRHPSAAWTIARVNLDEASQDRVRMKMSGNAHRLGNYEFATGKPAQALSHFFTAWAALKQAVMGGRPLVYLSYILGVLALAWWKAPRVPGMLPLLAMVTASLVIGWLVCMVDGADGGRHLTLFNYLLDLLLCACAGFTVRRSTT